VTRRMTSVRFSVEPRRIALSNSSIMDAKADILFGFSAGLLLPPSRALGELTVHRNKRQ
jgi:hypothetical protein